jgi:hypothetical protein
MVQVVRCSTTFMAYLVVHDSTWKYQEVSKICHVETTTLCIKTMCVCVCMCMHTHACVKFTGVDSALPADKLEQVVMRQFAVSLGGKVCLHCLSQSEQ